MRVKENNIDSRIKTALSEKPKTSSHFETALFEQAEVLLAARRERLHSREACALSAAQAKSRKIAGLREYLAIHPDAPAFAATVATLLLAFLAFHQPSARLPEPSYAELPVLPKSNDAPARYDAQQFAERQAYEREIEDAHSKTSGGI